MDLRYPIGPPRIPAHISEQDLEAAIETIAALPAELRTAVSGLDNQQLDTPYRPDGWTVRQVVHHLADSHINSYVRFRLALTEHEPTIKAYDERAWADLADAQGGEVNLSLTLLDSLHRRWVLLLQSLAPSDWKKTFRHPERGLLPLDANAVLYAWHSKHHLAHITGLRGRNGW